MKEYEFHEAANIFPLDEEHLDELAGDIRKNGQQVAIEIFDGLILDGRRRYLACKKAGKQPRFVEVDVPDPVAYVKSLNLHRRHLSPSQLAIAAAKADKLTEKYAEEAKRRHKEAMSRAGQLSGAARRGETNSVLNLAPSSDAGKTRDKIGKDFGVSGASVDLGRKVLKTENPKLIKAVESDLIAVSTAARAASLSTAEQDALVDRVTQKAAEGKGPRKRPAAMIQKEMQKEIEEIGSNGGPKGVGTIRALEAIDCLRRIPKHDALRLQGLEKVEDWIRRNK
jgi:ParB-like chromosome segregation protein Spo0J